MFSKTLFTLALLPELLFARVLVNRDTTSSTMAMTSTMPPTPTMTTSPPSPTQSGIAADCDVFHKVVSGESCVTIEAKYGITMAQFVAWNPYVNAVCNNLFLDYYVCVHVPGAPTSVPTPTPTPTGPQPQLPGIVSNCNKFHLIQSGENCYTIGQAAGITFDQFRSWNTRVNDQCSNLWVGYYACIGV